MRDPCRLAREYREDARVLRAAARVLGGGLLAEQLLAIAEEREREAVKAMQKCRENHGDPEEWANTRDCMAFNECGGEE